MGPQEDWPGAVTGVCPSPGWGQGRPRAPSIIPSSIQVSSQRKHQVKEAPAYTPGYTPSGRDSGKFQHVRETLGTTTPSSQSSSSVNPPRALHIPWQPSNYTGPKGHSFTGGLEFRTHSTGNSGDVHGQPTEAPVVHDEAEILRSRKENRLTGAAPRREQ